MALSGRLLSYWSKSLRTMCTMFSRYSWLYMCWDNSRFYKLFSNSALLGWFLFSWGLCDACMNRAPVNWFHRVPQGSICLPGGELKSGELELAQDAGKHLVMDGHFSILLIMNPNIYAQLNKLFRAAFSKWSLVFYEAKLFG